MRQPEKIKIFVVDDHQLVIDGITALLANEPELDIIGTCSQPLDAMKAIDARPPDVLLTDIQMPSLTGVELTRQMRRKHPGTNILALSMFGDMAVIREMLDSGICGYILKNTGKRELIEALKKVAKGENYFSPEITKQLMKAANSKDAPAGHLTDREIEIIRLIEKEMGNKQIADALCISERTVETHRKNIFRKTDTQSIIGLLKYAYEHKVI